MTHTLPITKAREELTTLVDNANKRLEEYIITVNGSPAAILMSIDEVESLKETLEIMSDKKLVKSIKQGESDIEEGRYSDWEDVKKDLGWNVQAKNNRSSKKTT